MSIKNWFEKQGKSKEPEQVHVDDMIILERWDEAEQMLKLRLKKNSRDLQAHIKLAKVYEDKGSSSGADNARATWAKLEQDGVSNILVSIPGAVARGILSGLEALESKIFENVR